MIPLPSLPFPLTIWHKAKATPYYRENSGRGVRHASRVGATAIDLDCQITRDGVIVCTHWPNPLRHGFTDPAGLLHRDAQVRHMSLAEVTRLRAPGGHRIIPARRMIRLARDAGVVPCFEVKGDTRFQKRRTYRQLRRAVRRHGWPCVVMTLPHLGGRNRGYKRLAAARAKGLPTLVLTGASRFQRGRVPKAQWAHVDLVKGPFASFGKPARVKRLGPGSKYGCSVGDGNARRVTRRLRAKWRK